jgi:hypothetical protein
MVGDHERGPKRSRRKHFDEWTRLVGGLDSDRADKASLAAFEKRAKREARELEAEDFSIHMHTWDQGSFLALLLHCRETFAEPFDIEATSQRSIEIVVVLRKRGAWPEPAPAEEARPMVAAGNGSGQPAPPLRSRLRAALRGGGRAAS